MSDNIMPRQTTLFKNRDEEWGKQNAEYFLGLSGDNNSSKEKNIIADCYDGYFGTLDVKRYNYVIQPYGDRIRPVNPQADLRNFPIIKPLVDTIHQEYCSIAKIYTVIATNSDVESIRMALMSKSLVATAKQKFINTLNAMGIDTEKPSQDVEQIGDIVNKYSSSNYRDKRAIVGKTALDYIIRQQEVHEKFKRGFLDFLISGYVFSLKEANSGEVVYDILDTMSVDFDRDPNIDFIEDGSWVTIKYRTTLAKIVEIFHNDLKPEVIEDLEKALDTNGGTTNISFSPQVMRMYNNNQSISVQRVFWKSLKKIGYVRYMDETMKIQTKQVDDDYKLDKELGDMDIEWQYIEEAWEVTKIGDDIYTRLRPCLIQRRNMDNPSICKLPANGRSYYSRRASFISLTYLGLPFQETYNIYKYRLEQIIARSKGVIMRINNKAKPDSMSTEEWMLTISELGFLIEEFDDNNEPRYANQSAIDLSFSSSLRIHLELLQSINEEWKYLAGVSNQRMGEIGSRETASGIQAAINQSSMSTRMYSDLFQHFEEREYIGLLDNSKYAWIEGKQAAFYMPDEGQMFLDIDGYEHSETNYGVFATNSVKEYIKVQAIQGLMKQMLSTGFSPSAVADSLDSDSMAKIRTLLRDAEQSKQAFEQQAQQQQQETLKQIAIDKNAIIGKELDVKVQIGRERNETTIRAAELTAMGMSSDEGKVPDIVEAANAAIRNRELDMKASHDKNMISIKEKELAIKKQDNKKK